MTENDDERSNAIDSAEKKLYSHYDIMNRLIYLDFALLGIFFIKTQRLQLVGAIPKKP